MTFDRFNLCVRMAYVSALVCLAGAAVPRAATAAEPTYAASSRPIAYQELPLPGGQPVRSLSGGHPFGDGGVLERQITLPFPVWFFGQAETEAFVGANGIVTFGTAHHATSSTPRPIPGATPPHGFVAVWWDQIACDSSFAGLQSGPVLTQELGAAPNRSFVVQWTKCRKYGSSGAWFDAQLWLFEGSSTIEVRYGDVAAGTGIEFSAAMGIESADGKDGTPGISATGEDCDAACTAADFPAQTAIVYSAGPSPRIASFGGDDIGAPGLDLGVIAKVENLGGAIASGVTARFWLAPTPDFDPSTWEPEPTPEPDPEEEPEPISTPMELGPDQPVVDVPPGDAKIFDATSALPEDLAHGEWWIFVEVSYGAEIMPGVFGPVLVTDPVADVAARGLTTPARIEVEGPLAIQWKAHNLGTLDAAAVPYEVILGTSPDLASGTTWLLDSGTIDLLARTSAPLSATHPLPNGVVPGVYYVGVSLDPAETIEDARRKNDALVSDPFTVGPALEALAPDLPDAVEGTPWSARITARGGDGTYAWSLATGSRLPPGIELTEDEGAAVLEGTPRSTGTFSFSLEVASIGLRSRVDLSLTVLPRFRITTGSLPAATVGKAYSVNLAAAGGRAPLRWTLEEGELPEGLSLGTNGRITGMPAGTWEGTFEVGVKDADDRTDAKAFSLKVLPRTELACADFAEVRFTQGSAVAGVSLGATGGEPPYRWSTVRSVRLADDLSPEPLNRDGLPPPGLALLAGGNVSGTPQEAGGFDWWVQVEDEEKQRRECGLRVSVAPDRSLSIVTTTLPDAVADADYHAQLVAKGGDGKPSWALVDESVLPGGLSLDANGAIKGAVSADLLLGEAERTFTFTVRAHDRAFRQG
ncbi:MAG TPA: Ig domain-containing protein, partial [Vulgatibacter sp.]|nr:Ig domain-containing protein [Vulgatibacter sp.]